MNPKFRITRKVGGFYSIKDDHGKLVAVKNKEGVVKPKRFKTYGAAVKFIKTLEYLSAQKGE